MMSVEAVMPEKAIMRFEGPPLLSYSLAVSQPLAEKHRLFIRLPKRIIC
jgi:hypothetical protein